VISPKRRELRRPIPDFGMASVSKSARGPRRRRLHGRSPLGELYIWAHQELDQATEPTEGAAGHEHGRDSLCSLCSLWLYFLAECRSGHAPFDLLM